MSLIATSPNSVRLLSNGLRFFVGQGAKRTVIATPTAILGTTALAPGAAAAVTVASVVVAAWGIFSAIRAFIKE